MTPPAIVIRSARMEDVDALASFSAALAMETECRQLDLERLRRGTLALLDSPAYGFFQVAEAATENSLKLVGQLMVTYEWSDWRNGVFWWIQSVYVDPAWRRQGVFRRMHEAVLAAAKGRSEVCGIRLYVDETNHIAQAAYRRVGLTPSSYAVFEQDFLYPRRPILQDRPDEA
jgi:ribosomal protein S18 acetylase RimI-like enzyme